MSRPRCLRLFALGLLFALALPARAALPPGAVLAAYAEHVHATYAEALAQARALQGAVRALVRAPSAETLAAAREAWLAARPSYGRSEAFRYYDGPIDFADERAGTLGPEGRMNAWPLNEAYIDGVEGAPDSGLVNDPTVSLAREDLLARNQRDDEAEVTTGWHAIEFLLWGQDLSAEGPGQRAVEDFLGEAPAVARRRVYLDLVTALLVDDLESLVDAWTPGRTDNFRALFLAADPAESLGRALSGIATLSGFELASERLGTALDSGDQEDEQSCFSDSTHQDILANAEGIAQVYLGTAGRPGLGALVATVDPGLDARLTAALADSVARAAAIEPPFDRILAAPPDSPARAEVEGLVASLQRQSELIAEAGRVLGAAVEVRTE